MKGLAGSTQRSLSKEGDSEVGDGEGGAESLHVCGEGTALG